MSNISEEIELLFEVSWEVCNKIGGIYTVLSSKAKTMKADYRDRLIFIGPDVWSAEHPSPFFVECRTPMSKCLKELSLPEGVSARAGRWEIPGKPLAILVKFDGMYANKEAAYGKMWERFGVDSLHAYGDYDEGCAFGRAAAEVIKQIIASKKVDPSKVVAHFDEWTTAMGLLEIKAELPEVATVFTTHATSIGRSICGNGKPLYGQLANYNGDQMARELNMESKHSLEKAAAWNADCFTTVSDVTATEAKQLLEREAFVTPNGFENNFVPGPRAYTAARRKARSRMLQVATALTGVDFPDDTFIVATSGRCEYRNKGLDVFLDAMATLEHTAPRKRKVLAFVMVPAWCGGPRTELAEALKSGDTRGINDPVITHILNNYHEDPVNNRIHGLGFRNNNDSNVSVIYVPCYLNGTDGIFDMAYYDLLPGMDATVFASYYEPWGYTPLESVAFGVPTITTTLAGFGCWVLETDSHSDFATTGVEVIDRNDDNYAEVVQSISKGVEKLLNMTPEQATEARKAAMATASKAQWESFFEYYREAYRKALNAE
ncbi:MAG: glycosyltransferase [Bacteroidales bacterium]|nr:glycosyltransferase [Bacteroidales bacterium]